MNADHFQTMYEERFHKGLCVLCANLINPLTVKKGLSGLELPPEKKLVVLEGVKVYICAHHPAIKAVLA